MVGIRRCIREAGRQDPGCREEGRRWQAAFLESAALPEPEQSESSTSTQEPSRALPATDQISVISRGRV